MTLLSRYDLIKADFHAILDDLAGLPDYASYDFASDLRLKMGVAQLSANALAERCLVTHPAVGKWLNGTARPHGEERFKELGLAPSSTCSGSGRVTVPVEFWFIDDGDNTKGG